MMDKNEFIRNLRNAFGNYELPIAIWYSEKAVAEEEKPEDALSNI